MEQRKEMYTTVFAQAFSPCGNYLAAGSNFGRIAIFNVNQALSPDSDANSRLPIHSFQAHSSYIYSFVSTKRLLISGGSTEIHGWLWKDVLHSKNPKPCWTLAPPASNPFEVPETNSMVFDPAGNNLITGSGDNNVYIWNLEDGSMKQTLCGHTDYVHCVEYLKKSNQVVSAGEDGTVRFWDLRAPFGSVDIILHPNENENAARPTVGKWIGCLAVDAVEDWMVCGGASHLSVWHLRSKSNTAVLQTPKSTPNVAMFHEDKIFSAGSEANVYQWSVNGECNSEVPCRPRSIFSLAINRMPNQVLAVAGSSSIIDICTNFNYKAFSFHFKS